MKFSLFAKISFEVSEPVALIESYCFQSDFYKNYDLLLLKGKRKVEDANKIGARIGEEVLPECKIVTEGATDLRIFQYDNKYGLDSFLELDDEAINDYVNELNERVIKKLLKIKTIGLSKATKVLHTLYPEVIPILDDNLQREYKRINPQWTKKHSNQTLIDYYKNLREGDNLQNLTQISKTISENNLVCLTKVMIFDILWWSYLKAKKLSQEKKINWSTIK
ncbi:MAG: hypothetical protein KAW00_01435 [Dehalococcoidia bacterium]|nr:hypothetical protein [Dehalococcoidia bacterium]